MKVVLRSLTLADAENVAAAMNNEKVLANLRDGIPFPYTLTDAEEYISYLLGADKNAVFAFAVEVDGKAAGIISAFRQNNIHYRTAELGYFIGEEYWGKGVMTRAAGRVLAKAGFSFEGVLVSNAYKNGKVLDMKIYALVREEECAEDEEE